MPTIRDVLERAWQRSSDEGLTLPQLTARAGLNLHPWSVSRKLQGMQPLTVDEAVALARALGVEIKAAPKRRKRK
jgi:hypothetical protein